MKRQKAIGHVCVIDDDAGIREMLAELLVDEGYAVVTAPNGQEALAMLRVSAEPPCVIVLDLMMPIMDGWQFRATQMLDPRLAAIPVLVLSAVDQLSAAATQLQVAAHIAKPIPFDKLLALIAHYCVPPTRVHGG